MEKVAEIAHNVHCVTVGESALAGLYPPNVYLVTGDSRAVFIDTAYGKDEEVKAHLDCWRARGKPEIAGIVLTHRHIDHIGGASRLLKVTGGEIICSAVEKEPIEKELNGFKVGRPVGDGETLDLGGVTVEFIHTPGHTFGSLCVYYREHGLLFTGDTILGSTATVISPDHGDMTQYLDSLQKLLGYESQMICPGHGPVIKKPRAKIEWLIERRLYRERQILDLLLKGERTIDELFKDIYSELDRRLHDTARSQICSHLIKLEREGKVKQTQDGPFALR